MGVHTGNPRVQSSDRADYFGPMVNRTARIANAGHGVNLLSAEVLQSDERLDVIKFIDLGVYRLGGSRIRSLISNTT